jgi:uroporphyrin-3 C-methyltransferase
MTDTNKPENSKSTEETKAAKEAKTAEAKPTKPETGTKTEIKVETKAEKEKPAKKPRPTKPAGSGNYLAKLALLSSLIIAGGIYYLWREHTDALHSQQQQLGQLQTRAKDQAEAQGQFDQAVKEELGKLHEGQQVLKDAVTELLKTNRHLRHEWLVAEAEYLVNLAGHRLVLTRDANTAISALKAADDRLREAGDPSLIVLRKALAEDISALEAVSLPDTAGLSLKLSTMVQDVDELPLLTPEPETVARQAVSPTKPGIENWRELPAAMWEDMKKLVIIRDHQGPIKPLLSPEQHFFLSQNLKLQLEQARLALLNGENAIYHERLDTAQTWLHDWFDPKNNRTVHMLDRLKELNAIDIQPSLPELTRTYQAFQAYQAKQDAMDAAESPPAEQPDAEPAPPPEPAPEESNLPAPANTQVPL